MTDTKCMECPKCRKKILVSKEKLETYPFCSSKCKNADLLSWLNGSYAITRPMHLGDIEKFSPQVEETDSKDNE